jgi:hypothetical protein
MRLQKMPPAASTESVSSHFGVCRQRKNTREVEMVTARISKEALPTFWGQKRYDRWILKLVFDS